MSIEPLWRATILFRVVALAFAVIIVAVNSDAYQRGDLAWIALGAMTLWTAFTSYCYAKPAYRRKLVAIADLVLTSALQLSSVFILSTDQLHSSFPTITTVWTCGPVIVAGALGGRFGGLLAGGILSVVNVVTRGFFDADMGRDAVLLLGLGFLIGQVSATTRQSAERLSRALQLEAATAERERLGGGGPRGRGGGRPPVTPARDRATAGRWRRNSTSCFTRQGSRRHSCWRAIRWADTTCASTKPSIPEVAAIVLLDSAHEDQWQRLPQEVRQLVAGSPPFLRSRAEQARQNQLKLEDVQADVSTALPARLREEHQSVWLTSKPYDGLVDEVAAAFESASQVPKGHSLGDLPLVVLTARNSYAAFEGTGIPTAEANRVWLELQNELASLSRRSTHLFSEHDHNLHVNDPEAVVAAIQRAVDEVRTRQPAALGALGLPLETLPLRSTPEVDRLLERLESAYNAMDAEGFVNLFAEDAMQLDVNRRVHVKGRAAWLDWTRRINAAHTTMKRRHRGRAKARDWVVAEIEWSGTVRGAAIGAATDRSYRYTGLGLLLLQNGKIRQQILYGDYASLTEQLAAGDRSGDSGQPAQAAQSRQQAEVPPKWVQADWEYYTRGTGKWIADNSAHKNENEPWDAYRLEWTWGLGKKTLRGRLLAMKDGKDAGVVFRSEE
ncbi:MAG TPA: hypothetical protein DGG94_07525, partial [Micromonosporaceae bacterium]|nr:hypothetical protein [Micromonosporaceae bacterium]